MTKEEYKIEKEKLKKEYDRGISALNLKFVKANNNVKVGDIVKDHVSNVKVELIRWGHDVFRREYPIIVFFGTCYTKANKPFKSGEKRTVWGPNIK